MIFLARKYKQKPRQWGPPSAVRSAVRDWFERHGIDAANAIIAYCPMWSMAGSPVDIWNLRTVTVNNSPEWISAENSSMRFNDGGRQSECLLPSYLAGIHDGASSLGYHLRVRYIGISNSSDEDQLGGVWSAPVQSGNSTENSRWFFRYQTSSSTFSAGLSTSPPTTAWSFGDGGLLKDGRWHDLVFQWDGSTATTYCDGVLLDSRPKTSTIQDTAANTYPEILGGHNFPNDSPRVDCAAWSLMYSALSADQIALLHDDPYGAIQPRSFPVYFLIKAPSATGYTLTCEGGSYSVTGTNADLLNARQVSAEGGAYVVNGTTASLLRNYVEQAGGGSYNLTGADAAFSRNYNLSAPDGAYNLTGTASALIKDSSLLCSGGSYNLTGTSANLLRLFQFATDSGTYTLNGQPVDLFKTSSLAAEGGAYSITGTDADLLIGRILQVAAGLYSLTGSDVTLTYTPAGSYTLTADSGMFEISGAAAELLKFYTTHCEPGTYTLTGQDANLLLQHILTAGAGSYILTGTSANLIKQLFLQANPGTYAINGMDAVLTYTTTGLAQGLVSITFTLKQPTAAFNLAQPTATFTLKQPTITFTN